jgi:hypothetical protein
VKKIEKKTKKAKMDKHDRMVIFTENETNIRPFQWRIIKMEKKLF